MARLARIAVANIPHHVTQRGNGRQFLLEEDADRLVYLGLLKKYVQLYRLSLMGYCLMSNHVHLILIPERAESLALGLKQTHGRYAAYWNATHASSGHVWQGRFYSCPLDEAHLWIALRYVERNPVRAGLVAKPELWQWSSVPAHCGDAAAEGMLDVERWSRRWTVPSWREYLCAGEAEVDVRAMRENTHTGRPLGTSEFVKQLEQTTLRCLTPQRGGSVSRTGSQAETQGEIDFEHSP
jgi:putative transposase